MDCKEYADAFKKFLPLTPEENAIGFDHIISAITFYYSSFNGYSAPFDDAMNQRSDAAVKVRNGFNLFMSKAQCGTCHFTPLFNGVKPPYVGSEFEVLGVPADTSYTKLSPDSGRYAVNPAPETFRAFRTGSIRNSSFTSPYMHNGVFRTMEQVIDFYDKGGGAGRKLTVPNQTLEPSPLHLTASEKSDLTNFLKSLDENIIFDHPPSALPVSSAKSLNKRMVGGEY
jgi:cytochrome c peroxidase